MKPVWYTLELASSVAMTFMLFLLWRQWGLEAMLLGLSACVFTRVAMAAEVMARFRLSDKQEEGRER